MAKVSATSSKLIFDIVGILTFLLLIPSAGIGQIIENPSAPAAKDAGRVLKLIEVWKITDEAGGFFFKHPANFRIADDGSIFIADSEQLLRFSSDGKFIKNLQQKGQGPGEIAGNIYSFFVYAADLFIMDLNSRRFWRANFDGIFQEQIDLSKKDYDGFMGVLPDGFLLGKQDWPPPSERTGKLMEIRHTAAIFDRDGRWRKDVATFMPRDYLFPQGGMGWDSSITALSPDGRLLYAFNGRDYRIEVIDLAKGTVIKRFNRAYPKVPHIEKEWEPDFHKRTGAPTAEYEIDIDDLYPVGDFLWVGTSTDDKAKGRLFDVFDQEGRFIDSFYLGAGKKLLAALEGCVFSQEKNEDETIAIVKYRIGK